jgi:hypothetical protein
MRAIEERYRNLLLFGEHPPSERALEAAERLYDNDTVTIRLRNVRTGQVWNSSVDDTFGMYEGIEVKLDECWKCYKPVPKDDDFGLCASCKEALTNLIEGGDGLTDQPTDDSSHGDEQPGTEVQNESEIGGFTADWYWHDDLNSNHASDCPGCASGRERGFG